MKPFISSRLGFLQGLTLALAFSVSPAVFAADIYEQGGANFDTSVGFPQQPSVNAGVSFGFPITSMFSVEAGLAYIIRDQGIYTFYTYRIPVLARAWIFRDLSVGIGGYFAHAFGAALVNGAAGSVNYLDYNTVQIAQDDLGLIGSVNYRFYQMQFLSFLVEGRYVFGLTQLDLTGLTHLHTQGLELTLVADYTF